MIILPAVILAYPPTGINIRLQPMDSFFLFLLTDMAEKFHQQIPVIRELPLKSPDTAYPLLILLLVQLPLQTQSGNLIHPPTVQKHEFPRLRQFCKISAKKRLPALLLSRPVHRRHFKKPGIYILYNLADIASLPGSSPTFHQHKHRNLMLGQKRLLF